MWRVSPYYQDEWVALYHGDCLKETAWLEADVLLTDPPYGASWKQALPSNAKGGRNHRGIANDHDTTARDRALEAWGGRPAIVFGSLKAEYPIGWSRMLVFEKPAVGAGVLGQVHPWRASWEPIFVLGEWPKQVPTRSAVIATRWASASGYSGYITAAGHPHAKPLDVLEELLVACPLGVVADPFAGSGSTLVAAKQLGRRSVGVELEERYCEIAARRLSQDVLPFEESA